MKDIYTEVTNRIISALEQGTPPWICPWRDGSALPSNLATGKSYRGINTIMLAMEDFAHGYGDSRWVTLKQANELGAKVRKGEHGTHIVFWKLREIGDDKTQPESADGEADPKVVPLLRSYVVFNASQLEFLPELALRRDPRHADGAGSASRL